AGDPASVAIVLGGRAMRATSTELAGRIAAQTGCKLFCETKSARTERGAGRVNIPKIPYPLDPSLALLKDIRTLIVVGTPNPVAFFAYPGKPRFLMPEGSQTHTLASVFEDVESALADLCEAVGARATPPAYLTVRSDDVSLPAGQADSEGVGRVLGALMPENAIIVDEAI